MTRCRVSEEDARDSQFDGLTDAEERAIATKEHMERRERGGTSHAFLLS